MNKILFVALIALIPFSAQAANKFDRSKNLSCNTASGNWVNAAKTTCRIDANQDYTSSGIVQDRTLTKPKKI